MASFSFTCLFVNTFHSHYLSFFRYGTIILVPILDHNAARNLEVLVVMVAVYSELDPVG